ncbi:hypothetical protein K1T73_14010 [Roseovarius sp. SCSIO 43702]|uniref:LPS assembly lipoprotein LptE n=1 Tax=Roseovarius sp. SCSIO 43702 TaxID=2823043 RepID=UPI001C72B602|nr:LPS assembly lipoprotein LptE [Roseovarius sp. SCSIO 43702]QYX56164.1 hypothetical protein K1T73_14010 [Roseovarius sp. SCSIO 43702]
MSLFNRRLFCLTGLAALAGCGFSPVYAPGGGGAMLLDSVRLDDPKTRADFLFVRTMEERLGRPTDPAYALSYAITLREEAIAISAAGINTRYNIIGSLTYALRDLSTGAVVTSGKSRNFTGYSASGTTVATQAAQREARARLMTIFADDVTTRLAAALTPPGS